MGLKQRLVRWFFAVAVAADTCDITRTTSNIKVADVCNRAYTHRLYWNVACEALEPSCVLLSACTRDVVTFVGVLMDTGEPFAVKSGGHNSNMHFASAQDGPLISTENLIEVTFDKEANTVRVDPGNRWEDVIEALYGTGYTVPGARIGHVRVGGLLLGSEFRPDFHHAC